MRMDVQPTSSSAITALPYPTLALQWQPTRAKESWAQERRTGRQGHAQGQGGTGRPQGVKGDTRGVGRPTSGSAVRSVTTSSSCAVPRIATTTSRASACVAMKNAGWWSAHVDVSFT